MSTVTLRTGVTLSYVEQGSGPGAPIVCLPGPTDSSVSYEAVLDALPSSVRAVAVSPRGHGDSTKPAHGYRVEDFAADVVPLIDALDIGRAVLVGHSGSCLVARRAAIDHPDRVAGLVLEASPTTLAGDPKLETFVAELLSELTDPIDRAFLESVVFDTSTERHDAAVLTRLVDEVAKVPSDVWRQMFGALLHYDDTAELGRITAPTLLLWGDADTLVPREMQDALVTSIAGAELHVLAGAGHTPRWEDPAWFAAELAHFAASVTPPLG